MTQKNLPQKVMMESNLISSYPLQHMVDLHIQATLVNNTNNTQITVSLLNNFTISKSQDPTLL